MAKTTFDNLDASRFSRRWWAGCARTALLVTIVTVLIWVYADLEFTDTQQLRATILLTADSNQDLVILSRRDIEVTFTLRGNRGALDIFQQKLSAGGAVISFDVAGNHGDGRHALGTAEILRNAAGAFEAGLIVVDAAPAIVDVHLDKRVRKEVPVEFVYSNASLVEAPKLTMAVSVAASRWQEILATQPTPMLRTVNVDLAGKPGGERIEIEAQIVPFIGDVRVEPAGTTVLVPIEISQPTATRTLPVTVRVLAPPDWTDVWREYDLVRKDPLEWRPKITVSGAKKDLEQLGPESIHAYVELTETDKDPVSWLERNVQLQFLKGLQLQLVGEPPKVHFKLQERAAAPMMP